MLAQPLLTGAAPRIRPGRVRIGPPKETNIVPRVDSPANVDTRNRHLLGTMIKAGCSGCTHVLPDDTALEPAPQEVRWQPPHWQVRCSPSLGIAIMGVKALHGCLSNERLRIACELLQNS